MSDHDPQQLTLFTTSIDYSLRLQTQRPGSVAEEVFPLPAADSLEEAIDAARGFATFLIFSEDVTWGQEWDDPEAFKFTGHNPLGLPVTLEVLMQDAYYDQEGKRL